ncbi:MAG: hypothetical protein PHC33_05955 [Candidatus Omnitrophica bacterium]|nr:hypothetical protein [Candidatus Omnitrophota bacterium]
MIRISRALVIIAVTGVITVCLFILLTIGMKGMDNFKIKNIVAREGRVLDFSYLKGRNIFTLDLERESRRVLLAYPYYKKIRLMRVMPNMLFADCVKRRPLVCVDANRRLFIDEENVVYAVPAQNMVLNVPLIVGLEKKIATPKGFRKNTIQDLYYVLTLIKEAKTFLGAYPIQRIDMNQKGQAEFFIPFKSADILREARNKELRAIPEGLEVKVTFDDIRDKVKALAGLLQQCREDLYNIQYIDLRFKEPVIKQRQKN